MKFEIPSSYEFLFEEKLEDVNGIGKLLVHKKTGARVAIVENDDNNKVFSIGFRTPPSNSTGVAHIIEHAVLCGSKNFPAKDPFVELAKGSLNTFLNAMTYPDKTVYPVASINDQDFKNLMHVYMDAVLYPNIYQRNEIFRQEGWHYELEDENAELKYNGVVYNEMKGAFSSPESQLYRSIQNSLFPDTSYGVESGGDPDFIPELSYEEFIEFHKTYYHP
ncbi:MAG: insulinase family protein, partial [Herbinix sp.]|nr:insulinase family protein [Herbinix sp.]